MKRNRKWKIIENIENLQFFHPRGPRSIIRNPVNKRVPFKGYQPQHCLFIKEN